jgi:hypothetical protein
MLVSDDALKHTVFNFHSSGIMTKCNHGPKFFFSPARPPLSALGWMWTVFIIYIYYVIRIALRTIRYCEVKNSTVL